MLSQYEIAANLGNALFSGLGVHESPKWPACGSMALQQGDAFLAQYKVMAEAVPFAIQVPSLILDDMVSTRPILLLTILLTGSSSDPTFEDQAAELFRHVLADRVLINSQKSLELLQSLLTYLTWYHHRFARKTVQFWQFLHLGIGMIGDLGLPRKYAKDAGMADRSSDALDEIRAFLLCYYLSCGGGVLGYDRPENMRCIESMRNAAKILADSSSSKLDREAPALIELLHIVACQHNCRILDHDTITLPAGSMSLQEWEKAYLQHDTSATLRSSFHFIAAYTVLRSLTTRLPMAEDVHVCVYHFDAMLSNIVNQQITYLPSIGIVEWAHLITTLFLLARLGGFDVVNPHTPDSVQCQTVVHQYVGQLQSLLGDLRGQVENKVACKAPHLYGWLDRILIAVLTSSKEAIACKYEQAESAYELVNSFLDKEKPDLPEARLIATASKDGEREPVAEDFWSEFMLDWSSW